MKRRALLCFIICLVLFFVSVMRVTTVATTDFSQVRAVQNGLRLKIADSRGTIYDCNRVRLTNTEEKIIACVSPTPRAITAISQVLQGDNLKNILKRLKSNKPALCEVPKKIQCDGIICTTVFSNTNTPARHIIGYTDSDNIGVSGLEKAYNSLLHSNDDVSVFYTTDAKGRILEGVEPELSNNQKAITHGVVTTIDTNIQAIAENYATFMGQ